MFLGVNISLVGRLRSTTAAVIPAGALQQRDGAYIFDRAGDYIEVRTVVPFTPADLFASGEEGAWYDPSDLTTLGQTSTTIGDVAVGDPVGFMGDKSKGFTLGAELVTNGTFDENVDGWTDNSTGTGLVAWETGEISVSGTDGSNEARFSQEITLPSPGIYEIRFNLSVNSGGVSLGVGSSATNASTLSQLTVPSGENAFLFYTGSATRYIWFRTNSGGGNATIDNISVRELPGNHATQSTAASRPTLRQAAGGEYYLEFDGVDDDLIHNGTLLNAATSVSQFNATQRQELSGNNILYRMALHDGGLGGSNNYVLDRHNNTETHGFFINDGSVSAVGSVGTSANNTSYITGQVVESGSQTYRVNGVTEGTGVVSFSSITTDVLAVGSSGTGVAKWEGPYFGGMVVDRLLTPTEIANTEAYLATKSGVTL